MSSMYTGQDIIINGMIFNRIDEAGNRWIIQDLDGWWGLPEPTVPDDPRQFQDDGSYFSAGRYEARQIEVVGVIAPGHVQGQSRQATAFAAAQARDALNRAMNLVRTTAIMQVNETSQPKIAAVQLVGKPLTKFNTAQNVLEFNFQLRAADPRKYSLDPVIASVDLQAPGTGRTYNREYDYSYGSAGSTGLVSIENVGSYNTYGIITIKGPVVQPTIEHVELGHTLSVDISLGEHETLEINLKDRTILLNSDASRRNLLGFDSRWFWFLPGTNTLHFTGFQIDPPHPEYPEFTNLASNPSFETAAGAPTERTNWAQNPRAIDGLTGWSYTGGTDEEGSTLVATGQDQISSGITVRRNHARNPQAVGEPTGAVNGYGGSIPEFGEFPQDDDQLVTLLTPGTAGVTRTNYAYDPRTSRGHGIFGDGWRYVPGTGEQSVSISSTQTDVVRTNLWPNPRFAAAYIENESQHIGYNTEDVVLGTAVAYERTSGLGVHTFATRINNWGYAPNTKYTVSFKIRFDGHDSLGTRAMNVYLRPLTGGSSSGQVFLGTVSQAAGDAQSYVFTGTTNSASVSSLSALSFEADKDWGIPGATFLITDLLIETGHTSGAFFDGNSPEENLPNGQHAAYQWTGTENESTSEAVYSLQSTASGPDGVPGFVRQIITSPKTTAESGWTYYDSTAALPWANGEKVTASLYVRSTAALEIALRLEQRVAGLAAGTPTVGSAVTLVPNEWTRISVTDTAEGASDGYAVQTLITTDSTSTNLPTGTTVDAVNLLVERGAEVDTFFDGDFEDTTLNEDRALEYAWSSTVGRSASVLSESIVTGEGDSVTGPIDQISTFARAVIVQRTFTDQSGWESAAAALATPVDVSSGERFTVSIYARYTGPNTLQPVRLTMRFHSTPGDAGTAVLGPSTDIVSGAWTRLSVSGVAGSTYSAISWSLSDTLTSSFPSGSTIDVAGVLIEQPANSADTDPGDYFDGNTSTSVLALDRIHNYSWVGSGLVLDGSVSGGAGTPHDATFNLVDKDLDVRVDVHPDTWRPASGTGGYGLAQRANETEIFWSFWLDEDGYLSFLWSPDGTVANAVVSTSTTAMSSGTERAIVRATLDVDNGSSGSDVRFWYTTDDDIGTSTWFQLGTTITSGSVASVYIEDAGIDVGHNTVGTSRGFIGEIYAARVITIDTVGFLIETTVADPDFSAHVDETTAFEDSTSKTWTVIPPAIIDTNMNAHAAPSVASLNVWAGATGPLSVTGLVRREVTEAKSTGDSDLQYESEVTGESGDSVTVSAWVRSSEAISVTPVITLLTAPSTVVDTASATAVVLVPETWTRVSATVAATGSYDLVRMTARLPSAEILPADSLLDMSSVLIDVGASVARPYFDGDISQSTADGVTAWSGDAHQSTSTLTVNTVKTFGSSGEAISAKVAEIERENMFWDPIPEGTVETWDIDEDGDVESTAVIIDPTHGKVLELAKLSASAGSVARSSFVGHHEVLAASTTYTIAFDAIFDGVAGSDITLYWRPLAHNSTIGEVSIQAALEDDASWTRHTVTFTTLNNEPNALGTFAVEIPSAYAADTRVLMRNITIREGTHVGATMNAFSGDTTDTTEFVYSWANTPYLSNSVEVSTDIDTEFQEVFQATSWSLTGSHSLGHTVTASPSTDTFTVPLGSTNGLTLPGIFAGSSYTFSVYMRMLAAQVNAAPNARTLEVHIEAPSLIGGSRVYRSDPAVNAAGVDRVHVSLTIPEDATSLAIRLVHGSDSGTVYWDGFMIEPITPGEMIGLASVEYLDGDSIHASWTGTPHDSTSHRDEIPEVISATAEIMMRSAWIE